MKAIILDDSGLSAKLVRRLIERLGFEVRIATTLEEFRSAFDGFGPSVIFSDLQMPEVPDDSVCRVLRTDYGVGSVPIWILSSLEDVELANRARLAEANGFLSKNLTPDQMQARLAEILERCRGRPS